VLLFLSAAFLQRMAPRKGESADDKCRRHAQNQAKSFYQGVKIRVQDTIKRKPEILPALEKWMVDNGHMGFGMGGDVPYKTEPKTPVKSHVKHEESDGAGDDSCDGLARSVDAEFDDACVAALEAALKVDTWDKNITKYGQVPLSLWQRALSAAEPAIFSGDRLKIIIKRGARALSQSRLMQYGEFIGGVDKNDGIPKESRTEIDFIKHV
jgi:hypothetical protein